MSRVYIGRLSYRAREKDVERFFKGYGKILEVDLKNGYGEINSQCISTAISMCRPRRHVRQWLGPCLVPPLRPVHAIVVSFLFGVFFVFVCVGRKGNLDRRIAEMARPCRKCHVL